MQQLRHVPTEVYFFFDRMALSGKLLDLCGYVSGKNTGVGPSTSSWLSVDSKRVAFRLFAGIPYCRLRFLRLQVEKEDSSYVLDTLILFTTGVQVSIEVYQRVFLHDMQLLQ
jgi:hypothetical protein